MVTSATAVHSLVDRFRAVRDFSHQICEPLQTEDFVIQSMPDVSPTRWHLAHTTWFFETFVLKPFSDGYQSSNKSFEYLFNSYYNTVGRQYPRDRRGLLSRPSVAEIFAYRKSVDQAIADLLQSPAAVNDELMRVMELGLQHEQQHQELMVTDIKHVLSCNPLFPVYRDPPQSAQASVTQACETRWISYDGGEGIFGCVGEGFSFDNETPQFANLLQDYALQDRLITNGEYLEFVQSGGYRRPEHWLSMGWHEVQQQAWNAPLYWHEVDNAWHEYTLHGLEAINLSKPVTHVSYFEADAFARWSGFRLPTEFEWEAACGGQPIQGNFAESKLFHPSPAPGEAGSDRPAQMFGDVWEWTSSQYSAYPGYQPPSGALGEYNGKFMCNQFVLRGGSCATSQTHIRPTYRNFFPPNARWQFTGIRLAR